MPKSADGPEKKAKAILGRNVALMKNVAPELLAPAVGTATMELLNGGKPVNKASLLAWFDEKISTTASAKGVIDQNLDVQRAVFEVLRAWLSGLPGD